MTRYTTNLAKLALLAALSSITISSAATAAEIGSESIMLEQIGAVRMVSPAEERQVHATRMSNEQSHQSTAR